VLLRKVFLIAAFVAALPLQASQSAQCTTRACLIKLADDYLAALVAHDPKRLPLALNFRFVENVQAKKAGEGLWQTASAVPTKFKIYVPDPVTGQIGFMGMMDRERQAADDRPALEDVQRPDHRGGACVGTRYQWPQSGFPARAAPGIQHARKEAHAALEDAGHCVFLL
jgi:hypothetical protein